MNRDPHIIARQHIATPREGEEVCITGVSGSFPKCNNILDFEKNLFDKTYMVQPIPEIPFRTGKLLEVNKFDAGFFGIHHRHTHSTAPGARLVLEKVYEAIFDAGVRPEELRGTKTGVFVSCNISEAEGYWFLMNLSPKYNAIMGSARSALANRISFALGVDGPSFVVDSACSSSGSAVEQGYRAIREGKCEQALVCSCNLCLYPYLAYNFASLGVLSSDGVCKSFDNAANGYARAEAVGAIFLQKSKDARRIYAQVVHAKTNCDGYSDLGITHPSGDMQQQLLEEFYCECNVDRYSLTYMEGHVTGTKVGDPEEVNAIDQVLCKGRAKPLYIGSVKSNMGHAEAASGFASLVKAIIAFESGYIPPNLHLKNLREGIEGLQEGRLLVATEKTPLPDENGLIGINNFGIGGANSHLLLRWNSKKKINNGLPQDDLPRLVCVSGRSEDAVIAILDDLNHRSLDVEYVRLLHELFSSNIDGHIYRGFTVLTKERSLSRFIKRCDGQLPLALVIGDFNRDHLKYMKSLLIIPSFENIINGILTSDCGIAFQKLRTQNTSHEMVTYIILQVAFIHFLKHLGIHPKHTIGHGLGEIISAYVNELLTLKEIVLFAQEIGKNSKPESEILVELRKNNNFTKKGLCFQELPVESIVVQFGPGNLNGLFNKVHISLNSYHDNESVPSLLEMLGQLYLLGINFKADRLYPDVEWPVSRSTPMLSPLIKWNHLDEWFTVKFRSLEAKKNGINRIYVDASEKDWLFLTGHIIDGRILFPATGYLFMVWETLAVMHGVTTSNMKVMFENVKFMRATTVSKESIVKFEVMIQKGTGKFELIEDNEVVATGIVSKQDHIEFTQITLTNITSSNDGTMTEKDVYKELRLRGYNYSGLFCSVKEYSSNKWSLVKWEKNWITFLDGILQLHLLKTDTRNLNVAAAIKKITIDPKCHLQNLNGTEVPVYLNPQIGLYKSAGVEMIGLQHLSIKRKTAPKPLLETYCFVPNESIFSIQQAININLQIIIENCQSVKIKIVELIEDDSEPLMLLINEMLNYQPLIQQEMVILTKQRLEMENVKIKDAKLSTEKNCSIIIIKNIGNRAEVLQEAFGVLRPAGFILCRENLNFDHSKLHYLGIDVVTVYITPRKKLVLIRKKTLYTNPATVNVTDNFSSWLPQLQNAIKTNSKVMIYSNEPLSGILGLNNCLRREIGSDRLKCVFMADPITELNLKDPFYKRQLQKNLSVNVYKNSQWGTYRHLIMDAFPVIETEHCIANITTVGDLSSFKWIGGPLTVNTILPAEKVLIQVHYSALNYRDYLYAAGQITGDVITTNRIEQDCLIGIEFAGKDLSGKRVMGLVASGSISTLLSSSSNLLWTIPNEWSMEEAATIPYVYSSVIYAFHVIGNVRKGKSVLIHSGSSDMGQAALRVALWEGLTVFATGETEEKRKFIKTIFPDLDDSHILDASFHQSIMAKTMGRGVDYVFNSVDDENFQHLTSCLAHQGMFFQLGKSYLAQDKCLNLKIFDNNCSFHSIDVLRNEASVWQRITNHLLSGIQNGCVKPITRTIFQTGEIAKAFSHMKMEGFTGKTVIKIRDETETLPKAIPEYYCNCEASYIITGGLGGFGLELADWLVLRGARNILLTSRSGVKDGYQSSRIHNWKSYGVRIRIPTDDITIKNGCQEIIEAAANLGPVEGIFHLALVLSDSLLENQTVSSYEEVYGPKAKAAENLDILSRKMCPRLKNFVVFSSLASGRGNLGQTNYGMASSVMERICEQRKADGLPSLAIQWGAIDDVGTLAEEQEHLEIAGCKKQRIFSCLETLNSFLHQDDVIVSSQVLAEKCYGSNKSKSLVETVISTLGLRNLKTVSAYSTLPELGMDSITSVEIKQTLEREFEIFLTQQNMQSMTLSRLQELADKKYENEQNIDDETIANT